MQSGYGSVSEIPPQFMVESCGGPSLFAISSSNPSSASTASADMAGQHDELKYHPLPHPHHHPNLHHSHQQLMPHLAHFHSIPITQQLFQQPHHQFQLFHHHQTPVPPQLEARRALVLPHQLGIDQDSGPENSASFLAGPMSFKLAMNDSSGGGSRDGMNEDEGIIHGDDGSESRLHHWQREDESAIKEPSWRPLDIDYINRNKKRCKDKELDTSTNKYCTKTKEVITDDHGADARSGAGGSNNFKVFSELEAIYKPGSGGAAGPNQTGSGSALTGDETPIMHATTPTAATPGLPTNDHHVGGSTETSAGEEAPVVKLSKGSSSSKRKRKRRRQQQLSSVAAFFESLVKQLIDHQEGLHKKFLAVMEKRDHERAKREEAWRKQESAKKNREAAARAQERALTASREDAIIAFLEKITGESLNLPPKPQFADIDVQDDDGNDNDQNNNGLQIELAPKDVMNMHEGQEMNKITSRWPKMEVEALIRVRSGLESRFQEPGLKGPLWDEVSAIMTAMGYPRSPKRCKEKWENINKYFRKTKESGKKRPEHSKTCPYFQQLDQLYSKSMIDNRPLPSSSAGNEALKVHQKHNSELLDAILGKGSNEASGSGTAGCQGELGLHGHDADNGNEDNEDDDEDEDEEGIEREEGEGESQDHHEQQQYQQQDDKDDDLHESALFFQRLQS